MHVCLLLSVIFFRKVRLNNGFGVCHTDSKRALAEHQRSNIFICRDVFHHFFLRETKPVCVDIFACNVCKCPHRFNPRVPAHTEICLNDKCIRFSYGHAHWRTFTSQNYFDPHGVFIGGIVAAPVFAILILQLVSVTLTVTTTVHSEFRIHVFVVRCNFWLMIVSRTTLTAQHFRLTVHNRLQL